MSSENGRRPLQGEKVLVTGLGVVAPNGVGRESFWQATLDGTSGVRAVDGFDVSDYPTRIAGAVRDFDGAETLPAKERRHVPRTTVLALAAATEALEDAGLDPAALDLDGRRRFASVIGTGAGAMEFSERQFREYYLGNKKTVSLYTIPSATAGTISSELAMRFDLRGPSHVLTTGCTSSTDGLGHALSLIRYGRVDRVLVGGADAPIAPGIFRGFCLLKVMTPSWNDRPEGGSRPFSKDRDGFVLGEGSWMLVLESEAALKRRGGRAYAELAGYGSTCEAFHRVRLDESGEEPARAMTLALQDAGLDAGAVDYVSLHGTSTMLNDRIETRAVRRALGQRAERVPGSSVKSMVGHPQGASGSAGVAAALLAMRDGKIPPTINVDESDPECDLDVVPHRSRTHDVGVALCNCIGFGSKNSALVLRAAGI